MKLGLRVLVCCLALFAHAAEEEEEDPLPKWSDADAQRVLAGEFLPTDMLLSTLQEGDDTAVAEPGLQLPEPGPESLDLVIPTEIADEELAKFFAQKHTTFLIDPQTLLSRQEYRDCLSFLDYHASDSNVDLLVYLFDKEQIIPPIIKIEDIVAQYQDAERPAVLVFYYLGAPERSEIHLDARLMRAVGEADRQRALQKSINQAVVKSQPVDQLDGFCVQMSIRIYWMEKAIEAGVVAPLQEAQADDGQQRNQAKVSAATIWLKEWSYPLMLGIAVVLVALVFGWIRRAKEKFSFVEFEVVPRMGGAHAAGVGAVISYASAKMPPIQQREQVPDYLRRM